MLKLIKVKQYADAHIAYNINLKINGQEICEIEKMLTFFGPPEKNQFCQLAHLDQGGPDFPDLPLKYSLDLMYVLQFTCKWEKKLLSDDSV